MLEGFKQWWRRHRDRGRRGELVANEKQTEVYYRLARSMVTISGTVTHDFDPKTSKPRSSATSDIAIGPQADAREDWRFRLPMGKEFMKSKDFELAFTPDGRLTSSSATVSGAGAKLIEAGVRVAGFLGATALALAKTPPPAGGPPAETFDETLAHDNQSLFDRREAYRRAITELQDALVRNAESVATDPSVPGRLAQGGAVFGTLERLRLEAAEIEAQVDALKHTRFPTVSEPHEFRVGTDALPRLATAEPAHAFAISDLPPALRQAATTLGVVVARVGDATEAQANFTDEDRKNDEGIWYRIARPTSLAIYDRQPGEDGPFTLRSVTPEWVIDDLSLLGYVGFNSGIFDKQTGTVDFDDTGALSKIGVSSESAAGQLSAALAAAPGQLKESFDQAVAVVDSYGKLRAAGAERQLADIDRRRKILEADIAEKGVLATKAQRAELEQLDVEVKLAEDRKKLAIEPPAPPSPNKELEDQLARTKLELELKKAQIEIDSLKGQ
jgi:hypothetical protein